MPGELTRSKIEEALQAQWPGSYVVIVAAPDGIDRVHAHMPIAVVLPVTREMWTNTTSEDALISEIAGRLSVGILENINGALNRAAGPAAMPASEREG